MGDVLQIKLDSHELTNSLEALAKFTDKGASQIFREEFVLLLKTLIKFTPPTKKSNALKSIDSDLRKLFRAAQKMEFREQWLQDLTKANKTNELAKALNRVDGKHRVFLAEAPSDARHKRNRNKRGRIVKNPAVQVITKAADYNKFARKKKQTVGKAKAGWIPTSGVLSVKQPAWLTKQKSGKYTWVKTSTGLTQSITNTVNYISALDSKINIVDKALKIREKAIMTRLKKAARIAARKTK